MPAQNPTLSPGNSEPPSISSMVINSQYVPGLWNVTLTYSDGTTQTLGLSTLNVQKLIDNSVKITADNSLIYGGPFPNQAGGTTNPVKTVSKVMSVNVSDSTQTAGN